MPETVSAKTGGLSFDPTLIFPNLFRSVSMLAVTQGPLWVGLILIAVLVLRRHQDPDAPAAAWYAEDHGHPGISHQQGTGPWSVWGPMALVGVVATWSAVLLGGFAVKQVWVISRYVSPLAPALLLAMSVITEWLLRGAAVTRPMLRSGRGIIMAAVIATVLMNWWVFSQQLLPHARNFPVGLDECYLEMGAWLKENTPEDAVVAALDIGALGYASQRPVLDLMGLVSPEILKLGREMGFREMVESGAWLEAGSTAAGQRPQPSYFVDRSEGLPRWADKTVNGVRFEVLDSCIIAGVGLNEPQPWTVTLYRLTSTASGVNSSTGG